MSATLGGYRLISRIAAGGMAEVFLARKGDRSVALKRILPHLDAQPEVVARFLDEARLAFRLSHPHIVRVHDFGRDADTYYLAMEHIAGEDLTTLIRRAYQLRTQVAFPDAAAIVIDACEALHHAHEQGVIHRDVTPSNLLISYDGVVKLADFGIAKGLAAARRAGAVEGKAPYMSPEQAHGRPMDRRSDVYSLGVCARELVTGKTLPSRGRDAPAELESVLRRALLQDPDERWPTARAFGKALRAWLAPADERSSRSRLRAYMTRLFGEHAAERLRTLESPVEVTQVGV